MGTRMKDDKRQISVIKKVFFIICITYALIGVVLWIISFLDTKWSNLRTLCCGECDKEWFSGYWNFYNLYTLPAVIINLPISSLIHAKLYDIENIRIWSIVSLYLSFVPLAYFWIIAKISAIFRKKLAVQYSLMNRYIDFSEGKKHTSENGRKYKRCIMIFPEFSNISIIDDVRTKYDPLAGNVRPHITLVFPFESYIKTEELKEHLIGCLSDFQSFDLTLKNITPIVSYGNYLFLNIDTGMDKVIELHKRLYSGILKKYMPSWLIKGGYYPHMTVGKIEKNKEFKSAIEEVKHIKDTFNTVVKKISVEIIDENEDSIIEIEVGLKVNHGESSNS